MKKYIFTLLILQIFSVLLSAQPRRLFDYEQREDNQRPKPDLRPNILGTQRAVSDGFQNPTSPCPSPRGEGKWVGSKAPGWQSNGIVVCDTSWAWLPKIVSDGNSGAIICWAEQYRGADSVNHANWDIYAQRVDSGGHFMWQSQGVPVCSLSTSNSWYPAMISDGYGGAIIAWEDYRDGLYYSRIFAQRLDSMGNRVWPENGVLVCNQMSGYVDICSDGHGGAIIAYVDGRDEANTSDNIYAQRIDSAGNPAWTMDGVPVCTADSIQFWPHMCATQNNGAVITWEDDYRYGSNNLDAFTQLIDSVGDMKWVVNGLNICDKSGNQKAWLSVPNYIGGGVVTWLDIPAGSFYIQSIDSSGLKQMSDTGKIINYGTKIVPDKKGGGIFGYRDSVNRIDENNNFCWGSVALHSGLPSGGEFDMSEDNYGGLVAIWNYNTYLYAQRVDSNGVVLWETTGVPVCTTMNTGNYQKVIGDMAGGAIATWWTTSPNSLFLTYPDILVQRIYSDGTPGGVLGYPEEESIGQKLFVNAYPNPAINNVSIAYVLPGKAKVRLNVYNTLGQKVRTLVNENRNAGKYTAKWDARDDKGKKVSAGIYFYRLETAGGCAVQKMVLVK